MALPCVEIQLPPEFAVEPLGFGLEVGFTPSIPERLLPWFRPFTVLKVVSVRSILFEDEVRTAIAGIVADTPDLLTRLGTKSNLARVSLLCASTKLTAIERRDDGLITISVDPEEWFQIVAPQLSHLEIATSGNTGIVRSVIMAAACRYLELSEEFLGR